MSLLGELPEAEWGVWHKVNGVSMTRAIVMGEPVLTRCGKRLRAVTHTRGGSDRLLSRDKPMPSCPACNAIEAYLDASRAEWSADTEDARRLV